MTKLCDNFGFEWSRFPEIHREYEANFLSYVEPLHPEDFKGKVVVDAGCGSGRHAYYAVKYGAEFVVALDASEAVVSTAEKNLWQYDNVVVEQGNIYDLAVRGVADIVMCIGVLHHLPDPCKAFGNLVRLLKPDGVICIWVYSKGKNRMARWLYEPIRRLTTRIPHSVLYRLCFIPAVIVELCNRFRITLFRQYRIFPFKTKWNDSFDVFATPLVRYCTHDEVRGWLEDAGLKDIVVAPRMLNGVEKGIRGIGKYKP